jgi:hypothetical protein
VAQSAAERQRARRARLREQRQAQARKCCACGAPLPQASRGDRATCGDRCRQRRRRLGHLEPDTMAAAVARLDRKAKRRAYLDSFWL